MKKKTVFAMALAVTMIMGTTVFAAEVNNGSHQVTATYVEGSSSDTIYSVDVSWGSMEFTYTSPAQGTWDPETHEYLGAEDAGRWTYAEDANKITVTNHSNARVEAGLTYTAAEGYENIEGTFDEAALVLPTAVGTEADAAPSDSALLEISGELPESEDSVTVGTVTVTLNK